jgi:hypothetical protein
LPQLLYWKYLTGHYLAYSYGDEKFIYWKEPKFLGVWFAPINGLFLYNPLYLILIAGMLFLIWRKSINGYYTFILFLVISYLFASWHSWFFGCAFGGRSFVEFLAVFSIPFASLIEYFRSAGRKSSRWFWAVVLITVIYSLKITYVFDGCFYGNDFWDWKTFLAYFKAFKKPF